MTEKRFKTNEVGCIVDYEDNLKNYDGQEIVDLLNNFAEENKHLKKENKKLQDEYDLWIYSSSSCEYDSLKEENERLKQRIKSRLHYYHELYESTKDNVVKRVIEDLEDILK